MLRELRNLMWFLIALVVAGYIAFGVAVATAADQRPMDVDFMWMLRSEYVDGTDTATHYKIFMDSGVAFHTDGTPADNILLDTTQTETSIDFPEDGLSHNFYMRAVSVEGESGNSDVVRVDPVWEGPVTPPPAETPDPPNTPDAPKTVTVKITFQADQITVE